MVYCAVFGDRSSGSVKSCDTSYGRDFHSQGTYPLPSSKRPYSESLSAPFSKKSHDHYQHQNRHHPRPQRWQDPHVKQQQQHFRRPEHNYGHPAPQNYQGHHIYNPLNAAMDHPQMWHPKQMQPFDTTRPNLRHQQFQQFQQSRMGQIQFERPIPSNTYFSGNFGTGPQAAVPRQYFTTPQPAPSSYRETVKPSTPEPSLPPQLNVNELYEQLKQNGVFNLFINEKQSGTKDIKNVKKDAEKKEPEKISFDNLLTIKTKHPELFKKLYEGNPCSSCGLRFGPEETKKYRQHLDWHFRENKREKEAKKKPGARSWYFGISNWIEHEITEDEDDRKPCYFETQMKVNRQTKVEEKEPCVPAGSEPEPRCKVCRETFKMYFDDDEDDWYIRPAVKFQDTSLHPVCVEDYKKMLARGELDSSFNDSSDNINV